MMKQIDEQGYKDGGAAFAKGKSLRQLIEPAMASVQNPDPKADWQADENYHQSVFLGFSDALLTKLRAR